MSYQSIHFLLFTAVVLILYYIVGPKRQKWVLLLANLYFFLVTGIVHIPVILVSMICSFFAGRKMGRIYADAEEYLKSCESSAEKKQVRAEAKSKARKILVWSLVIVLGLLVGYKCAALVINAVNETTAKDDPIKLIMPLGISYYTFMAVSYMLDIYWRKVKAEQSFVSYAAFLSYFPHIVQGPIDRYHAVGPQINQGAKLSYRNITFGAQLAMWGFFKKMVIADRLSIFVNAVFSNFRGYSGSILLVAAIFSAFELYCNFSGCMDIVRGISQMFGIEIARNFDHPFFSKSVSEFWRRWHITLGTWFKDYVYMPITISPKLIRLAQTFKKRFGDRAGKAVAVAVPTAVVWLLTGIWHGTGWNYVVWGIYWGVLIILPTVFRPEIAKLTGALYINTQTQSWKIFQMVRTFLLFVVGRILSSCNTVHDAAAYLKRIFCDFRLSALLNRSIYDIGWDRSNFQLALILLCILWAVSMLQKNSSVRQRIAEYNIVFRWIIYYALFFAILVFGIYGPGFEASSFVYGNF